MVKFLSLFISAAATDLQTEGRFLGQPGSEPPYTLYHKKVTVNTDSSWCKGLLEKKTYKIFCKIGSTSRRICPKTCEEEEARREREGEWYYAPRNIGEHINCSVYNNIDCNNPLFKAYILWSRDNCKKNLCPVDCSKSALGGECLASDGTIDGTTNKCKGNTDSACSTENGMGRCDNSNPPICSRLDCGNSELGGECLASDGTTNKCKGNTDSACSTKNGMGRCDASCQLILHDIFTTPLAYVPDAPCLCSRLSGSGKENDECTVHENCALDLYCSKSSEHFEKCQPKKGEGRYCGGDQRKCQEHLICKSGGFGTYYRCYEKN